MSKAADIRLIQKPPHTFELPPRAFSSRWAGRPTTALLVGLRIASAEERLLAATEATERADRLLPGRDHADRRWAATYEVSWIHYLLGHVLTSPNDVNAPLWAVQDGTLLLCEQEPHAPGDSAVVSMRFSDEGIARVWDEYDALCIRESPVWPEATDDEVKRLGARLVDGSFFEGLDAAADNPEAKHVAAQLRRLLHYVVHLRGHGRESAVRAA